MKKNNKKDEIIEGEFHAIFSRGQDAAEIWVTGITHKGYLMRMRRKHNSPRVSCSFLRLDEAQKIIKNKKFCEIITNFTPHPAALAAGNKAFSSSDLAAAKKKAAAKAAAKKAAK